MATGPGENLFLDSNRRLAEQILHLSFDVARAKSALFQSTQGPTPDATSLEDPQYRSLEENLTKLDAQVQQTQTQLGSLQRKLRETPRRQRKTLESSIADVQSRLALIKTRRDDAYSMLQFIGGHAALDSLTAQIDALERTIPESRDATSNGSGNAQGPTPTVQARPGLWGILTRLYGLSRKYQAINGSIRQTTELEQSVKGLQAPLNKGIADLVQQTSTGSSGVGLQNPDVVAAQKNELDAANSRFKLIEAVLLPLSKEAVLLESYEKNLLDWRAAVGSQSSTTLKDLLFRLLILGVVVGIVLGVFELWRRAILRYVPDLQKRFQFMLMRRIALVCVLSLIVLLTFLNALGSLATFAGLLTAGIAVALQNVFLAIVGYFILIGKSGVRAGNHVQIGDVKGEVVDIGMLRLHLLEEAGSETDVQPTGRLVAFPNSVVFQPGIGFFKRVPNTSLIWREISLTLAPESDRHVVNQRVFAAVDTAFKGYQQDLERLRSRMEKSLESVAIASLEPKIRYKITAAGIEIHIRFPVELQKAAEIDDRITHELIRALETEPRLRIVEAEGQAIRRQSGAVLTELDSAAP